MKTSRFLLPIIFIITIFSSCKKDSNDNSNNQTNKIIFSSRFETQNDLTVWIKSSGGDAIIDSSAVKFTNITGCFHYETMNLIPVQKGKTYELKLKGKVNYSIQGDPVFCAGNFIINVVQGDSYIIDQSFGNYPTWTQRSFSFEATSGASIKIAFLIGTTRGAWIDDIELIEN